MGLDEVDGKGVGQPTSLIPPTFWAAGEEALGPDFLFKPQGVWTTGGTPRGRGGSKKKFEKVIQNI